MKERCYKIRDDITGKFLTKGFLQCGKYGSSYSSKTDIKQVIRRIKKMKKRWDHHL